MYKEKELVIPLYKTIVRPHLEYCIQAWRPYRKKDIDNMVKILNGYENIDKNMFFSQRTVNEWNRL